MPILPSSASTPRTARERAIMEAMRELDFARATGDQLRIALAEAALNDLLDRYSCNGKNT